MHRTILKLLHIRRGKAYDDVVELRDVEKALDTWETLVLDHLSAKSLRQVWVDGETHVVVTSEDIVKALEEVRV